MATIQNLQRVIGMRGTKTNIESLSASLEEQAIAYASDTGELGIYTNGAWAWIVTSLALDDLTDVNATSPSVGDVIYWDGVAWSKQDPNRLLDSAWGSMYQDDTNTTISITGTNVDFIVTGMSQGILGNTIFQNSRELKIITTGVYKVDWSLSMTCVSANQEIEGAVGVNGIRKADTSAHDRLLTGTDTINIGGTGLLSLAANDLVQIVVRNETSTANVNIQHANLSIVFLGLTTGGAMLLEDGYFLLLETGDNLLLES